MTTVEQIVPADVVGIRQGYGLVRTYSATVGGDRYAVRVDIERNAYDFQSHYRTEFLTAEGWKPLHRIPPEDDSVTRLPSYVCFGSRSATPGQRAGCVTAVEELAERLLAESTAILSIGISS